MAHIQLVGGLDTSLSNIGMSSGMLVGEKLTITRIKLITTKEGKDEHYKNMRDLARAKQLYMAMHSFFNNIPTVYVEIPVGSKSARAMASYGICVGILASLGKRLVRVSATDVKLFATGNKQASKADMIDWATDMYPHLPWLTRKLKGETVYTNANEHVADSIASILVGINYANISAA